MTSTIAPHCHTVTSSSDSSSLCTSTVLSSPFSANAALPPHPRLQTCYRLFVHSVSSPLPLPPAPASSSPPYSLRVLQWNAGGLHTRSTELLHFHSFNPLDLICIQKSNLNLSSFFRIAGFSALRSDRTQSLFGNLSRDATHAVHLKEPEHLKEPQPSQGR